MACGPRIARFHSFYGSKNNSRDVKIGLHAGSLQETARRERIRQIGSYILTRVGGCQAYEHAPVDYDTLLCPLGSRTDRRGLLGVSSLMH